MAAQGFECDRSDIKAFTEKVRSANHTRAIIHARARVHVPQQVLAFWAKNHSKFPTWAKAARITFALSPNSASSERVFSLLKLFFGEQQDSALSDMIEVALMLAYNDRKVG